MKSMLRMFLAVAVAAGVMAFGMVGVASANDCSTDVSSGPDPRTGEPIPTLVGTGYVDTTQAENGEVSASGENTGVGYIEGSTENNGSTKASGEARNVNPLVGYFDGSVTVEDEDGTATASGDGSTANGAVEGSGDVTNDPNDPVDDLQVNDICPL